MKITKTINLELNIIGHRMHEGGRFQEIIFESVGDDIEVYCEIIRQFVVVCNESCDELVDITTIDGESIELSESDNVAYIAENDRRLFEQLHRYIKTYLKENKLPYRYMNQDVYNYMQDLSIDILGSINCGFMESTYIVQKGDGNFMVCWEVDNQSNILSLKNKYLNKEIQLKDLSNESINQAVLQFNKEWNSIIDGKFEY